MSTSVFYQLRIDEVNLDSQSSVEVPNDKTHKDILFLVNMVKEQELNTLSGVDHSQIKLGYMSMSEMSENKFVVFSEECAICNLQFGKKKNNPVVISFNRTDKAEHAKYLADALNVKISRLQLLDQSEYIEDLDKLLDLVAKAELPYPVSSVIDKYRQGRRFRESDAYTLTIEVPSTVASKGCYDMSNFDISSLHDKHKVSVNVVRLNNDKLRNFIANRLFNDSMDELGQGLTDLVPVINKLRSHFIYLREKKFNYTEPSYFQPLFTLFLERVASRIGRSTCNKAGAAFPLSMDAEVMKDNGVVETVTITGKSDVVKVPTCDDCEYHVIEFLLELKNPFASLYHATSDGPKNQLVSQLLALWEMSGENRVVSMGGLSDIFALFVCFAYSDKPREFSMTKSVVGAEEYLLHLMLLFCSDQDIRELVDVEDIFSVPHEDPHNDENAPNSDEREPDAEGGGQQLHGKFRRANAVSALSTRVGSINSAKAGTSGEKNKKMYTAEEIDAAWDAEKDLQDWYARHNGLQSLNKENIDKNQQQLSCHEIVFLV